MLKMGNTRDPALRLNTQGRVALCEGDMALTKEERRLYDQKRYEKNKEAILLQKREYHKKNREKFCKLKKEYRINNAEKIHEYNITKRRYNAKGHRSSALKYCYGIDMEYYRAMIERQSGVCAICGKERKLVIDHDHKTGVVRGLLCNSCNIGIGLLKDDTSILAAAIDYLEKPRNE